MPCPISDSTGINKPNGTTDGTRHEDGSDVEHDARHTFVETDGDPSGTPVRIAKPTPTATICRCSTSMCKIEGPFAQLKASVSKRPPQGWRRR